jgi:DME family drug/metabolite transporter
MNCTASDRFAVFSVLGAACLWGSSGPAQALAASGANPSAVGAARLLLGGLLLGAVALASDAPVRTWLCGRDWRWLVLAAVSTGVFQAAFFAAVDRTGAGLATLVALGAAPAATGVCAHYLQGDPITLGWLTATVCAVAGCSLLLLPNGRSGVDPLGVLLALIAAGCYGSYTVAAKQLLRTGRPMEGVIAASLLGGGLVLAPAFTVHSSGLLSAHGVLLVAWLGVVCTALAYVLFVRGLRGVPASTAGTLSLAEPLVAVTVSALLLGERLTAPTILGGSLLLVGITFASLPSLRRRGPAAALAEAPS